jgi:hypothetical protein
MAAATADPVGGFEAGVARAPMDAKEIIRINEIRKSGINAGLAELDRAMVY